MDWYQRSEAETFLAYSLGFAEKPGQTNFGFPTKTSARSPQAGLFFGDSIRQAARLREYSRGDNHLPSRVIRLKGFSSSLGHLSYSRFFL